MMSERERERGVPKGRTEKLGIGNWDGRKSWVEGEEEVPWGLGKKEAAGVEKANK